MGYLSNIIKDARRTAPVGVFAGPAVAAPEAQAPPMDGDASVAPEQRVSTGAAAVVQVAAPAISGVAASEHLSITSPGIPLDAAPSPSYGGLTPPPQQTAGQAGDGVYPPAVERPSPAAPVDAGIVVVNTVKSQLTITPPVPERTAEAAGDGLARHGMTAPTLPPPFPAGCALPRESGRHGPATSAATRAGEPSTSQPPPAQEYARARLTPADSPGAVASPRRVAAGAAESPATDERQASASPIPTSPIPGNPEPGVSSPHPPLDRDVPNGIEAWIWRREQTTAQTKVIEPRVRIGRIDIVVQAPESPRQAPSPATTPSDLASRMYLRRL